MAEVDPRFAAFLRQLRHDRGLSLRRLGRQVHYSSSYLWDIERGHKPPTRTFAALLDAALGADGQLAALVTEPALPIQRAGEPVAEAARSAWPAVGGPASVRNASEWAQLATWLYNTFVRDRPPLVRMGAERYSRRMWSEGASPFRAEVASQGRVPHVVCHSVTRRLPPADVADRLQIPPGEYVTRRENRYYADGEPVQLGITFIPLGISLHSPVAGQQTLGPGGIYRQLEDLGYRVARIHEQIHTRLPTRHECVALKIEPTTPVLDLLHTAYNPSGEPFEVTRSSLRADLMAVHYEMTLDA